MKNYLLAFLLAVLVVLSAVSLRRSVAGITSAGASQKLVAIGTEPVPPFPHAR